MVNKHMKICSTSLVIKEMQIKTTINIISHPLGWLRLKRKAILGVGEDVENLEPTYTATGHVT